MTTKADRETMFRFFTEVAIVHELSTAIIARLLPGGLHTSHFDTLNHLMRVGNGTTPLEVAKAMQVSKATMTHTLSVLTAKGLIDVVANESDGRSKRVFLTEHGRAFREVAHKALEPAYAWLLGNLDIGALKSALPGLERVRAALEGERSDPI